MATGDISKQVAMLGEIAMSQDTAQVQNVKNTMLLMVANAEPLLDVSTLRTQVAANLGYMAGYLPVALGNAVLTMFAIQHPYFGSQIPESADDALALGMKIGKEYAKKLQTEAEVAKKIAQSKDLGVMLPESDESVTNDQAAKILTALKSRKGGTPTMVAGGGTPTPAPGDHWIATTMDAIDALPMNVTISKASGLGNKSVVDTNKS